MSESRIDLRKAINEVKVAGREDEQFEAYVSDIEPLLDALDSLQRELDQCIEQGEIQMMENAATEAALEARLSKMEGLEIRISDGTVWLHFPNAAISIESIYRFGGPGPIVKKNLRAWRDKVLAGEEEALEQT